MKKKAKSSLCFINEKFSIGVLSSYFRQMLQQKLKKTEDVDNKYTDCEISMKTKKPQKSFEI